jgi:rhamnosyltransferase
MGSASADPQDVCAVIVTYNPDTDRLGKTLQALAHTVARIVIVDNASAGLQEEALRQRVSNLVVTRLTENMGVAAAHNAGFALARALGYPYVLLLDQDSRPGEGMVTALLAALTALRAEGVAVGCVGARLANRENGTVSQFTRIGWLGARRLPCTDTAPVVECDVVFSSGSLVPMTAFDEVGGLEDGLFIDHVDNEWCLRGRAKGYRIFGACNAILEHRLGEGEGRIWLGRWRRLPRHKPFRYYYMFRNTILLCRRDYVPLRYGVYYFTWLAALFLTFGVFARDRNGELGMMLRGMLDGVRGITGKLQTE